MADVDGTRVSEAFSDPPTTIPPGAAIESTPGLTEIRSTPRDDTLRIAAFSHLAQVVERAAQVETIEPSRPLGGIPIVRDRSASLAMSDKARAELDEAEAAYDDARRSAEEAWTEVRTVERRLLEEQGDEEVAARRLDEARRRRRATERRLRRLRFDAEDASRRCSAVSRGLQDAHLRVDRL